VSIQALFASTNREEFEDLWNVADKGIFAVAQNKKFREYLTHSERSNGVSGLLVTFRHSVAIWAVRAAYRNPKTPSQTIVIF
jgi:hypothetical protein